MPPEINQYGWIAVLVMQVVYFFRDRLFPAYVEERKQAQLLLAQKHDWDAKILEERERMKRESEGRLYEMMGKVVDVLTRINLMIPEMMTLLNTSMIAISGNQQLIDDTLQDIALDIHGLYVLKKAEQPSHKKERRPRKTIETVQSASVRETLEDPDDA